jgi:hypothetical protein
MRVLHQIISDSVVVKKENSIRLVCRKYFLRFCHHEISGLSRACNIRDEYWPNINRCIIMTFLCKLVHSPVNEFD